MIFKRGLVVGAILLLSFFTVTSRAQIRNIIFDLGDVIAEKVGVSGIDNEYERKLKTVAWRDWSIGRITKDEWVDRTARFFDRNDIEKLVAWSLAERKLIAETVETISKLKKSGYKLYLLSNDNREAIEVFKRQKMPVDIFALFDGVIFSFEAGCKKPEPEIYQVLLRRYHLDPHECLFVDDKIEFIEGAKKQGIQGFVFRKETFQSELEKHLKHDKKGSAQTGRVKDTVIFDMGSVIIEKVDKLSLEKSHKYALKSVAWRDWQRGRLTEAEFIERTARAFNRTDATQVAAWSKSRRKLIDGTVSTIHELKNAGYKVYLLSNTNLETYETFEKWKPLADVFCCFDGLVLSFKEGCIKPEPEIYQTLLRRYHLDPHQCLFVDDKRANVEAAKKCGIDGIIFTKKTFPDELKKYLPDLKQKSGKNN